jgi:hypothetical protein
MRARIHTEYNCYLWRHKSLLRSLSSWGGGHFHISSACMHFTKRCTASSVIAQISCTALRAAGSEARIGGKRGVGLMSRISPTFLRLAAAAMLTLGLASCGETESYRYKLSLAVNTPEGVKRASSVGEVRYRRVRVPERGIMHKLQGEALYLDLGPGTRPLIALLTSRLVSELHQNYGKPQDWQRGKAGWSPDAGPGSVLSRIYGLAPSDDFMDGVRRIARTRGPRAISSADLPDLVTFADINEPKSVIEVDPNDLQATLGPNITWNEITLESTDEPITTGIRTKLPWLNEYFERNLRLDGSNLGTKRELANILSWFDFDQSGALKRNK